MKEQQNGNVSLTFAERLFYGLGTIGFNASYYWVGAFVQIYYTDTIGVSLATVSALVLAVRIFDALDDPLSGSIADRINTKWGRYRPWLLFAGIGVPVSVTALFSASASWSPTTKIVWMSVWYVIVTIMASWYDMPYSALHGAMSSKPEERVKISAIRLACGSIGTQITGVFGIMLILWFSNAGGARTESGYRSAVSLICFLSIFLAVCPAFKTKERVQAPPDQTSIPLKGQLQTLFKNPPVMIVTFAMFAFGFIGYGRGSMMIYYCTYVLGDARAMAVYSVTHLVGTLVGNLFVMPFLYRLIHDKGRCAALGHLCCGIFCLLTFVVTPGAFSFWFLIFLTAVATGVFNSVQYGMLGDAIDYGEYRAGLRCDGFLSSFSSFALKAGGAISPAIGLALLSVTNYVPNVAQTGECISAMKITISVIPAVCAFVTALLLIFLYRLTEPEMEKVRKELARRRGISE